MQRPAFFGRDAITAVLFVIGVSLTACGGKTSSSGPDATGATSEVIDAGRAAANAVANCIETCTKQASKCHVGCHGGTCSITCDGDFDACKKSCGP